jgi:hypothetical protein
MPDRTIDFKLTAKDGASAAFNMAADAVAEMRKEVEKDLRDIGNTATKTRGAVARAGGGGRRRGRCAQDGLEGYPRGKEGLERALKLGGALGIAESGRAIASERIPDVINKFHDDILKMGRPRRRRSRRRSLAGILPVPSARSRKGFRGAFDAIDAEQTGQYARQREAEPVEDRRDDRQAIRENRDTNRRGILQAGKDAGIDAGDRWAWRDCAATPAIAEAAVARDQENAPIAQRPRR